MPENSHCPVGRLGTGTKLARAPQRECNRQCDEETSNPESDVKELFNFVALLRYTPWGEAKRY